MRDAWATFAELNKIEAEMINKMVTQQEAKIKTYKVLSQSNLIIPPDLKTEVESIAYSSGYLCGMKNSDWWSPESLKDMPAYKMGYADGKGDHDAKMG